MYQYSEITINGLNNLYASLLNLIEDFWIGGYGGFYHFCLYYEGACRHFDLIWLSIYYIK